MRIISSQYHSDTIYFDNAATSFPKPPTVIEAVTEYLTQIGGNPGRSGHALSIGAGEIVFNARELLAGLFGVTSPMRVILCCNATEALNLAILGLARDGDHVLTTSMEHNSTIRPLRELEARGRISLTVLPCDRTGSIHVSDLEEAITDRTGFAVINHASNVFGTIQPLKTIGRICREHSVPLIADCAQSAGILPINMKEHGISLLAFAGHKGLYGPTGTGGLVMDDDFDHGELRPLKYGGTGSRSDRTTQPEIIPDRFESGTLNTAGLCGLAAGVDFLLSLPAGIETVSEHKKYLVKRFVSRAEKTVPGFIQYVEPDNIMTGVVSFNLEGRQPSEIAGILSEKYDIMCRHGLHCAPLAHRTLGTFPEGAVRFGFGMFNTAEEIDKSVTALESISMNRGA